MGLPALRPGLLRIAVYIIIWRRLLGRRIDADIWLGRAAAFVVCLHPICRYLKYTELR